MVYRPMIHHPVLCVRVKGQDDDPFATRIVIKISKGLLIRFPIVMLLLRYHADHTPLSPCAQVSLSL